MLEAAVKQQQEAAKEQERLSSIAYDIGQELAKTTRARSKDREEWAKRVRDLEGGILECPSNPGNRVSPPVNVGWLSDRVVGLLNESMCRGEACDPGRADDRTGESFTVQTGDFLIQADANHERWAQCRAQLKGWQDLARRNGWVK